MIVYPRKLSLTRSVHQHGHFFVRSFHRILTYPGYTLFMFLLIYLLIMDIQLYKRIRSRNSIDFNQTNDAINIFDPLPIKKTMVEPMIHYVRAPIAEHIESTLHFTHYFPFLSANVISIFHCCLSIVSIKFLSHECLFRRRLGVIIFQIRIFLDSFDGVIFRKQIRVQRYKSYYGDFGYFVDAFSDVLGGTCLILSCLIYFSKQRSNVLNDETDYMTVDNDDKQILLPNSSTTNLIESKSKILSTLLSFSLRYSIAAFFWDRSVRTYEDLLDSSPKNQHVKVSQLSILHSPLTILIFYLWRYLCALSIQDYLLFAIFIDRTWEFLQKTSRFSWCILFFTIILTELHTNQIRSLFISLEK